MYKEIDEFFLSKAVAIASVSRDKNSFSRMLFNAFTERGYRVYPINLNSDEICETKCYRSVSQLPEDTEAIYIIMRREKAIDLAKEAAIRGIKRIWIHVKCFSPEFKELSKKYGLTIIAGECFFMWAEPVKGFHRFHRFIRSIFDSNVSMK